MTLKEHRTTCTPTPYKDFIERLQPSTCEHCDDYQAAMERALNNRDLSTVSIGGLRELKKILQQINTHFWGKR